MATQRNTFNLVSLQLYDYIGSGLHRSTSVANDFVRISFAICKIVDSQTEKYGFRFIFFHLDWQKKQSPIENLFEFVRSRLHSTIVAYKPMLFDTTMLAVSHSAAATPFCCSFVYAAVSFTCHFVHRYYYLAWNVLYPVELLKCASFLQTSKKTQACSTTY